MASNLITTLTTDHEVRWKPGFRLGNGFNAVTGSVAATAVRQFTPAPALGEGETTSATIEMYEGTIEEDASRSIAIAAHLGATSGLFLPASLAGSARTASTQRRRRDSFFLVVKGTTEFPRELAPADLEMNADAAKLLDDPVRSVRFREDYGDYFIAGQQRRATFAAILTADSDDTQHLESLRTGVKSLFSVPMATPMSIDASLASQFDSLWSSETIHRHVTISLRYTLEGGTFGTSSTSTKSIPRLTSLFEMKLNGRIEFAVLKHYSLIRGGVGRIDRQIPILPDAFTELGKIRALLVDCHPVLKSLPHWLARHDPHLQSLLEEHRNVMNSWRSTGTKDQLPSDEARADFIARVTKLVHDLEEVRDVFLVWKRAQTARAQETRNIRNDPPIRTAQVCGIVPETSAVVKVERQMRGPQLIPKRLRAPRSASVRLSLTPKESQHVHVVGWSVTLLKGRSRGWWQLNEHIVLASLTSSPTLTPPPTIAIQPKWFSDSQWQFEVYTAEHEYLTVLARFSAVEQDDSLKSSTLSWSQDSSALPVI